MVDEDINLLEQGYCQNYPFRAHRDLPAAESTCPPAAFLRRVNKRFRTFTEAKILRIEKFLDQAIPKETLTRNHDSMDAFLELDVMFDPPPSQLVLYYFISLAFQKALGLKVDFTEVRDLMLKGGDINAKDNLGQTVLHDACRQMDVKTVRFLIDNGAEVNAIDRYGRTPLHVAAAFDNSNVIPELVKRGGDTKAVTHGEMQSAIHHAARNDSGNACNALVECGANIEARDYRGRTPLLLAADLDRSCAATSLLEHGACGKVLDYTGYHVTCAMIRNMPSIAEKALDQFHKINRTSRQEYFWLNYLEPSLISTVDGTSLGFSVLEEVVISQNQDLVKHPMIKEMIATKWSQFGLFGVIYDISLYTLTLLAWSSLVLMRPINSKLGDVKAIHVFIEFASLSFYLIQLMDEFYELKLGRTRHDDWKEWKIKHSQQDLQFILPKAQDERSYLETSIEEIKNTKSMYWSDLWNIYDWCSLSLMGLTALVYVISRIAEINEWDVLNQNMVLTKSRMLSVSLVISWFKMFKYVRVFKSLGPFVVIITNSLGDCLKIAFVYFVLYVPMVCVFHQFYGNSRIPAFGDVPTTMFTVFRMIVVDDYSYQELLRFGDAQNIGRWWLHVLVAYWILVSSVVLLNLFIALLSDTFQRVYDNAQEVAALERAQTIVNLEWKLGKEKRKTYLEYIKKNFSPKIVYYDDDPTNVPGEDSDLKLMTHQISEQVKNLDTVLAKAKRDKDKAKNCPNTLTKEYVDDKFAEQARLLRTIASKFDVLAERSDPGTPLSPVPPSYSYSTSSAASTPGPGLYSTSSSPSSASSSWTVTGDDMSDPLESVNSRQGKS